MAAGSGRDRVDEARQRYVEDFGLLFAELADMLQASRGSISQATRTLVQTGIIQRVSRPGERRDYFRVRRGTWMELTRQQMAATTTRRST
jgi:DNA-binding transcriptional regulator GbsR (MarR family)